jgi:CBS domain-containing protein
MKTTKAADVMTSEVITANKSMMLTEVMDLLLRWHISGLPVVDGDGRLLGIISEIDLVNLAFDGNAGDTTVEEAMTADVVCFAPDADLSDMVMCFSRQHLRRVPIVEDGKVVGIVSRRDILREMLRRYQEYGL